MASLWELFVRVSGDNSQYKQSMQETSDITSKFGALFDSIDAKLGAAIGFGTLAAGAIAAANKFEAAGIQIQRATGATGDKLDALEKSFENVYTQTAKSSEQVSSALSLLSTRTQATGKDLENLTLSTLKLSNVQGEDIGTIVPSLTQMFGAWSIATNKQADATDYLRVVSQQTGTKISTLTATVTEQAPMLKLLGYNWQEAAALVGSFDKSGALAQGGLSALKKVLADFAKNGVTDTAAAWKQLVQGVESGSVTFQQFLAIAGNRGGTALFDAIKSGKVDVDNLVQSYTALEQQGSSTAKTLHEKYTIVLHDIESMVSAHKDLIVTIGLVGPGAIGVLGAFKNLASGALPVIANIAFAFKSGMLGALTSIEAALAASGIIAALLAIGAAGYKVGDMIQQKFAPNAGSSNTAAMASLNARYHAQQVASGYVVPDGGNPTADILLGYVDSLPSTKQGGGTPSYLAVEEFDKALKDAESTLGVHIQSQTKLSQALATVYQGYLQGKVSLEQYRAAVENYGKDLEKVNPQVAMLTDQTAHQLAPTFEQLASLPMMPPDVADLPVVNRNLEELNPLLDITAKQWQDWYNNLVAFPDAFRTLGIVSTQSLIETADTARQAYEAIRNNGMATAHDVTAAWIAMERAQIEADYAVGDVDQAMYEQRKKNLEDAVKADKGAVQQIKQNHYDLSKSLESMAHSEFDSMEHSLAEDIVKWKGWSQTIHDIGQKLAVDFVQIMLKGLLNPLENLFAQLAAKIGGILSGIFGGSGGSTAGSAASTAGSAASSGGSAASAAGSAVSSAAGWITAGASVINGIVSGIQGGTEIDHLFDIMDSTNKMYLLELQNFPHMWLDGSGVVADLDDIKTHIWTITDAVKSGNAGGNTFQFFGASLDDVKRELKLAGVLP